MLHTLTRLARMCHCAATGNPARAQSPSIEGGAGWCAHDHIKSVGCNVREQSSPLGKSGLSTPDPDIRHETCQHLQRDDARIDKTFGLVLTAFAQCKKWPWMQQAALLHCWLLVVSRCPKLGGRREEAVLVSRFDLARSNKMHSVTFEFSSFSVIVCVQK